MSEPAITVVRGNPTDVEVAALVGVLAGMSASAVVEQPPTVVSAWWASGLPRGPQRPGPAAWRASAR